MTDDSRFRAPRAQGLPQTPYPAAGRVRRTEDPLAELARLIGQEDPFADFVSQRPVEGRPAAQTGGAQRRPHSRDTRPVDPRSAERRRTTVPARSPDLHDEHDRVPAKDERGRSDGRGLHAEDRARSEGRGAYAYGAKSGALADNTPAASTKGLRDLRTPALRPTGRPAQERHSPAFESDEPELDFSRAKYARDARSARRAPARPQDDVGYDEFAATDYDPEYDDDAYLPAHGDEFYDEAPRRRLKGWMLAAIVMVFAIVVGTSGLFAYRALFGIDESATPARVISPQAGPTKMVPGGAQSADNKRIQDRVGAEPPRNAERIVPRQENPIDQSRIPQGGSGDRIPAGTVTAAPQFSSPPSQANAAPSVAPANVSTEPRRVRTVTVRADGSVVADASAAPVASPGRAAPSQTSGNPMALQGQSAAQPPQRQAATASSAPLQGDNPWSSISSGQVSVPGTQAALPPQQAPVQSAPPSIAVQTPAAAGSYVVQVAAQKTEGEAQASWQSLQQRYGNVLGGQQATIRRVDLGERGVFYRAQVGPFSTRAQASEVCQSLKAAGGECVIQRN